MRLTLILAALLGAVPGRAQSIDPLPIDEAALATRLFEMASPTRGERAVIVYDPTYYPGITNRLREMLLERGVNSYTLAEDTAGMIAQLPEDGPAHRAREGDVVDSLLPLFEQAQIFYWMPERAYVNDLRWEILVERTKIRSIHFHWLLPFPGNRTDEQVRREHQTMLQRSLAVDAVDHAAKQQRLANALRGRTMTVTTAAGTELSIRVPKDEWFHLGDGNMSAARAREARSIRDREMELPVGMFHFVPDGPDVAGIVRTSTMSRVPSTVRDVSFRIDNGRMRDVSAREGLADLQASIKEIGEDGDKVATVWFHTNPHYAPTFGMMIEFGSNWENGGSNRAHRTARISLGLRDARIVVDGIAIMEDGAIRWDRLP